MSAFPNPKNRCPLTYCDNNDFVRVCRYADDIYRYLRRREEAVLLDPDFLRRQYVWPGDPVACDQALLTGSRKDNVHLSVNIVSVWAIDAAVT